MTTQAASDARLYFGNLRYSVNEDQLRELLASIGLTPLSVDVLRSSSGQSLGYGFVNLSDKEVTRAIESLNGQDFKGRRLRIERARDREGRRRVATAFAAASARSSCEQGRG